MIRRMGLPICQLVFKPVEADAVIFPKRGPPVLVFFFYPVTFPLMLNSTTSIRG